MYDKLAQAADGQVIVLNPDERVGTSSHPAIESNEPCITPTPTITSNPTLTSVDTSAPTSPPTEVPQPDMTGGQWIPKETATPPTQKQSGFETVFAIAGLLAVTFLLRRQ